MFDISFQGYLGMIKSLRADVGEDPSEHSMKMLARMMYDCVVQSGKKDAEEHGLLWETIYWCLRVYYTFGDESYLERAESVDSYRLFSRMS